ncbi:RES family NAD+ phosphorylase [Asticcacaulis sp.]|uniref:RES family NAD+ phosphorylase n=1 Tax=Asticcacaulis sp. TaxID=1872648 RepID=UPI0031D3F9A1
MSPLRFTGKTHRLIASRFPTIGVFDDIIENEDEARIAFELEAMTNGRLEAGARLHLLPEGGVATGPTASIAMAAFLHCGDEGGRFNHSDLGAWYAAASVETAIEETVYHNERRLRASAAGFPNRIQMRELVVSLDLELTDLLTDAGAYPELYLHNDYTQSQAYARRIRWPFANDGTDGIVYQSVRHEGGVNVCIFRPTALPLPIVQGTHYEYVWDAHGKLTVLSLTAVERRA